MITEINTLDDVATFTRELVAEGSTVHPDEDFREFVNMTTGDPTYTPEQADTRNLLMERAVEVCQDNKVDVYDFMQDIFLKETGLDEFIPASGSIVPKAK
jgi:hypothetical protein